MLSHPTALVHDSLRVILHGETLTLSKSSSKDAVERALALATTFRAICGSGKVAAAAAAATEAAADRSLQRFVQQFDHWREVFDASTFVSKAIASSKNFQFPVAVLASDTAIYDSSESLEAAIAEKQAGYLKHSINPERVHRLLDHHHPDFETVLEIATHGATIDEPEGFVRQPWPDPPREIVLKAPNNILLHANKFLKKGKAFVVAAASLRPADVAKNCQTGK